MKLFKQGIGGLVENSGYRRPLENPLGFPYGGEFSGPQDVIDNVFNPIVKYWPDFKVEPKKYNQIGNTVYVHVEILPVSHLRINSRCHC